MYKLFYYFQPLETQIDRRIDMGEAGFVFGIICMRELDKLVKYLKENDVIDKDYKFENEI